MANYNSITYFEGQHLISEEDSPLQAPDNEMEDVIRTPECSETRPRVTMTQDEETSVAAPEV